MKDLPVRSYVYYALCELSDAWDNLDEVFSRIDDDSVKSLISDIINDVDSAINKLHNISL